MERDPIEPGLAPEQIKFKKLNSEAKLPTRGSDKAACFDFYANRIEEVEPGKVIVYLGLACEFPDRYVLTIQPRSSFTHNGWVMANSPAQIDADYRGELMLKFEAFIKAKKTRSYKKGNFFKPTVYTQHALYYPDFPYKVGDRCAQGRLEILVPTEIVETGELSNTERDAGGFGSSGK